jgi:ABC-2 type transport system ATP-binding protein
LTASYGGRDGTLVRLRKGGEEAAALFRGLPGVETAVPEGGEVRIEWERGLDCREDIARLAVEKGLGLLEMRPAAMNIEDLYLKIVSGGIVQ